MHVFNRLPFLVVAMVIVLGLGLAKMTSERNAKLALGGDIAISRDNVPAGLDVTAYLSMYGKVRSQIVTTQAEARSFKNGRLGDPVTIAVKAIDKRYPLYGRLTLKDIKRRRVYDSFRDNIIGATVSPSALVALDLQPGEPFRIGESVFVASATIHEEPDQDAAPHLIVRENGFNAAAMYRPLNMPIAYHYRIKLPKGADLDEWRRGFDTQFADQGWHMRDWRESIPAWILFMPWPLIACLLLAVAGLLLLRLTKPVRS